MLSKKDSVFSVAVVVAALGYFVDIYDLLLFGIVRIQSLRDLGLSDELIKKDGEFIISIQMLGLMVGGIIWGIMGDKKGRLSVLFGSIILYSIANIANGFVQTTNQYALIRFIAGIGLAGELGAGITLVSETMSKEKRGLSTSFVAGIGLLGAVVAYFVSQYFHWRTCYFIGGALGFCLLILRVSVMESGIFNQVKKMDNVVRGNLLMFFTNRSRLKKYALSILIGFPTWYVIGVLVTFSKEFAKEFEIVETVHPGKALMYAYAGIAVGDIVIGFVSYWLRSRKKALYIFYSLTMLSIALFFLQDGNSNASKMFAICTALGFSTGFWAIFVTMAAEQFGTNLRATAATTIPNMVRGALYLILLLFNGLQHYTNYVNAGLFTGIIIMIITLLAAWKTEETFGKDLNYIEK